MPEPEGGYLLDTNIVRAILNGEASVAQNVLSVSATNLFLSAVAVEEMIRGRLAEIYRRMELAPQ